MTPFCTPERLLDLVARDDYDTIMSIQTTRTKSNLEAAKNMPVLDQATLSDLAEYLVESDITLTAEQLKATLDFFPDVIINVHSNGVGDTESMDCVRDAIAMFYIGTEYHSELTPLIASQILNVWDKPMPVKKKEHTGGFFHGDADRKRMVDSGKGPFFDMKEGDK